MPMEFINQNILLISLVVVSGLSLLWPAFARQSGNGVSPGAATQLINREDARVVDVREAEEFAGGHMPDAINIPVGKLAERVAELEKFKDKPVIVCCAAGMRSSKACGELKKHGFDKLYNLVGGVDAWVGAGYPIKKGGKKK
ncbi:rhodanese-like domain-containing protein [Dechloromonas sp. ARDL1]|uniref:rhodanese-like domain-containing protein n=1 Tax=Dechloromonas sp. ARDL1 TaxID=3322121 RepID=UPI003DA72788